MKTILITGAAQGIGLATALRYAKQGWFVALYDINKAGIDTLLASGDFPNACGGVVDVTDCESLRGMFDHFTSHGGGKLDLFINNAGVLTAGDFVNIDPVRHDQMVDVNVRGATHALQLAFPLLKATPGSTVVNLCSASSIHGVPGLAVYSATKFYIDGLTEALDIEWRQHGIRVTCVKPPVVKTAMGLHVETQLATRIPVNLGADDVAAIIQRAAEGRGTSHVLGSSTSVWAVIDKFLPNPLRHALTRYLAGV